ncbi:MAG: SIR2 family NAD-dependent protein deacylase [Anaerovoracaceae bacterium]|jgi:NAD-dependent deacetylase
MSVDKAAIEKLAEMMKNSKYTVVLTGAGMSTESGIPDFRSEGGWWRKINPATVATVDALENNYELFKEFYKHRFESLQPCSPNVGHHVLASWENRGLIKSVMTQNVDGLHRKAGNVKVHELHGSIENVYCHTCGKKHDKDDFIAEKPCRKCGGKLRPGVVLFGESLPALPWENAYREIETSDLLLVIGTSLNVSPVNTLPLVAGGERVLINMESTGFDNRFNLIINDKAGSVLNKVNALLAI